MARSTLFMRTRLWNFYAAGLMAAGVGLAGLSGCESSKVATSSASSGAGAATPQGRGERPMVAASAAEKAPGTALSFFDELEVRPLAAQDDAVHASLLLGTGSSGVNVGHRVGLAHALGYVPEGYAREGREAVTVGEVSQMFAAVLTGKRQRTADDAVKFMVANRVLAKELPSYQGMTGAQLVSMIGAAQDAMGAMGVARVTLPTIPVPAEPSSRVETASNLADTQGGTPAPAGSASPVPAGRGWVGGAPVKPVQEATVDPAKATTP